MAKFSKQDYVGIANVIRTTFDKLQDLPGGSLWQVRYDRSAVTLGFADMFAADNPRFDRQRFVMACEGEAS